MLDIEMIAIRSCSKCGQTVEATLKRVEDLKKNTTPWIMFYTDLFQLPSVECCGVIQFPTHVSVTNDGSIDSSLFSDNNKFKIGSEEVPVIIDEANSFAVTRPYKKQLELEQQFLKQNKLWDRQKEDFFHKTYTYFSLHFEQIIDEMDHLEVLDILRTFEESIQTSPNQPRRFIYKGKNERKLITKWIKKEIKSLAQAESEEMKKYFFYLIVEYFVQLKLIPQIHYLKWDVQKFEKMIGESLLTYLLVTFPLTSYFSFMKDEAILRQTNKGHFQKELRQLLEKTQKDLSTVSANNSKMQQTIESQRKAMADLEKKNERLQLQNSRLEETLKETGNELLVSRQAQKIKELKGLIKELQNVVRDFRQEREEVKREEVENSTEPLDKERNQEIKQIDFSPLKGKTVGIFGDIQIYQIEAEELPCRILSTESLRNPNAVGILKESDVLVVLTQHISHSCMWSIKEFANQNNLPVVYSRHTNVEIILKQVLEVI